MRVCPVCGHQIEVTKRRGRPQIFHPDCKKLTELLSWIESLNIDFADSKHKQRVRANLFYLSNTIGGNHEKT